MGVTRQPVTGSQVGLTLLVALALLLAGLSLTRKDDELLLDNLFSKEGLSRLVAFYPFLWIAICCIPPVWVATRRTGAADEDGELVEDDVKEATVDVVNADEDEEDDEEDEPSSPARPTRSKAPPKTPDQMKVRELQLELRERGVSPWKMRKTELVKTLQEMLDEEAEE
mmetsp:Transcript_1089/g.2890  ORF Transcript_1089/g.2890 Transcript_1089/m.2890 type:complete len:169 (-) Transcript_1089:179-685(-)|eukprot:CAMPEP_0119133866 /NCGR_PEP_ID=MMETSP1310-20130426/14202_1 /TAXON_ID=464262 /ORGANISM="Genus nov. species nov., Strain RCC2339" /LENGTH=168 /DNA_ID=CAMNT_0007124591 /DNA_START=45 /DNA_END=551 /DNA_ORIENTATION=-